MPWKRTVPAAAGASARARADARGRAGSFSANRLGQEMLPAWRQVAAYVGGVAGGERRWRAGGQAGEGPSDRRGATLQCGWFRADPPAGATPDPWRRGEESGLETEGACSAARCAWRSTGWWRGWGRRRPASRPQRPGTGSARAARRRAASFSADGLGDKGWQRLATTRGVRRLWGTPPRPATVGAPLPTSCGRCGGGQPRCPGPTAARLCAPSFVPPSPPAE